MMKGLLNVLHPAFESLSAYADAPETAAPRTHVARHVARCAECRAVVADIGAMGEAARASLVEEAVPRDIWSRIERAAALEEHEGPKPRATPAPDAAPWEAAPSLRPTRHVPLPIRRSIGRIAAVLGAAAAALLVVVLFTGRTRSLLASDATRLSFTPFRPAPGAVVHVRYNPSPKLAGQDRLVLIGQYINDAARTRSDYYFGGQYDSLATLTRSADGAMVGEFRVPADFRAASLIVADPTGRLHEDGLFSWILVGGDRTGRPSLASLLAAASLDMLYGSPMREHVLDTLQKYFPDHPAGFATATHYRGEGKFSGMFKLFQGAERKYLFFNAKLDKAPSLDVDRIAAMINFARQIEEPTEAARWTRRLVREHPADPRTLPYFARVVHDVELREPPRDSITAYLPLLDSLLMRAGPGAEPDREARALVNQYGDDAMQRRWLLQTLDAATQRGQLVRGLDLGDKWLRDAEIRRRGEVLLRAGLPGNCPMPRWLARGWTSPQRKQNYCTSGRAAALASLSDIALRDGQTAHALALADSAVALVSSGSFCLPTGRAQRGEALLASGDTLAAAREFAPAYGFESWQSIDASKAAVARLRPSVTGAAWEAMRLQARADRTTCMREASARDSLERAVR